MEPSTEAVFVRFELEAVWERYQQLRLRDFENYTRIGRIFGLMILYAAAPFSLRAFVGTDFIRVWGLGGAWLAMTVWFICDRDFRSYGFHLKERQYCLHQLAAMRSVFMAGNPDYFEATLLPWKILHRRTPHSGFPEYLSPRQLAAAAYFFKVVTLFPVLYLYLFSGMMLFPRHMLGLGSTNTLSLFLRLVVAGSVILLAWIWTGSARCTQLERQAFSARRISVARPWPLFPEEKLSKAAYGGRKLVIKVLATVSILLAAANILRGIYLLENLKVSTHYWEAQDVWLGVFTAVVLVALFLFEEVDIRYSLHLAGQLDPVSHVDKGDGLSNTGLIKTPLRGSQTDGVGAQSTEGP